ncbi:hypothetical protein OUW_11469 [Mycobacteroides abscessus M93]|nr:hypothetical protein OUW_11469 [Mycobacteroides abscessus M93]
MVLAILLLVVLRSLLPRLLPATTLGTVEPIGQLLPVVVDSLAVGCVVVVDGLLFAIGGAVVAAVLVLDRLLTGLGGLAGLGCGAVVDGDPIVLIHGRLPAARLVGGHGGHGGWNEFGSASWWAGGGAAAWTAVGWAVGACDRDDHQS